MEYDDSLERALERTPDVGSDGERFELPDPGVRQEGTVTVFENFRETVDRLDRPADHVVPFLQKELGTSGHLDERGRARLTGDFREGRVADAVEAYTERFVTCPECGLADTELVREQDALVLQCAACGARSATS